ncbi:MAG: ribonuclease HI [Spirochaetota bacterium]|nr:ribonuclease HI [Spirochaetota bacterium]
MKDNSLIIYTDGGCSGNPGPGGWACVLIDGDTRRERSGGEPHTTNNRMELTAVIEALKTARSDFNADSRELILYTDSQYVKNGITDWILRWEKNGWMTAGRKPVKNREYWQELKRVSGGLDLHWKWVKGHSGNELNERCDEMVQQEIARFGS